MKKEYTFLTYSTVKENDIHKGISLDAKGLTHTEIQLAIDGYKATKDNLERENMRLNKLVDELLNENKILYKYRDFYRDYRNKYDSD